MQKLYRYWAGVYNAQMLTPKQKNIILEYVQDFNMSRAALVCGVAPRTVKTIIEGEEGAQCINTIMEKRQDAANVDATWVLLQAKENHFIARQSGELNASNAALNLIAKHSLVDALAVKKTDVKVSGSKEIISRLLQGRKQAAGRDDFYG